jgi:nitroreductase
MLNLSNSNKYFPKWTNENIDTKTLHKCADFPQLSINKWGLDSLEIVFIQSQTVKRRLLPFLMLNKQKISSSPVIALLCYKENAHQEYENINQLYSINSSVVKEVAKQNATMSINHFMVYAQSLGLSIYPVFSFDNKKVDDNLLNKTKLKSIFMVCMGYAKKDEKEEGGTQDKNTKKQYIIC